jgi:DNA-binding transcriptional ArsR family regulator
MLHVEDIYFVETFEQLRVLSDPFRIKILYALDDGLKTSKMIADDFGLAPSKVRYHMKELERAGLVKIEKTEEKNGILQKFYGPVANVISLDRILPKLNGDLGDFADSFRENALLLLDQTKAVIRKTDASAFNTDALWFEKLYVTPKERKLLEQKMRELNELILSFRTDQPKDQAVKYQISMIAFPVPEDNGGEE